MHPLDAHLIRLHADQRLRDAADRRLVAEARRARRQHRRPGHVRVAVGQRLVRLGERLAGAPPSRLPRRA